MQTKLKIQPNNIYQLQYHKQKKSISDSQKSKILGKVEKNMRVWWSWFGNNLQRFRDDKYFYAGDQWQDSEYSLYTQQGKTPYTVNKLKPLVRQLCGEQQNMQSKISILPNDSSKASFKNVEIMADFLRYIGYSSHANVAYSEAFFNQLVGGWGVIKVQTEYVDPYKFEQDIKITAVVDPLTVIFDPAAVTPTKTDGDFQAAYYIMPKNEFEKTYYSPAPTGQGLLGDGQLFLPVVDEDSVAIVDYYEKRHYKKQLIELSNGVDYKVEVLSEHIEEAQQSYIDLMMQRGLENYPPLEITNQRSTTVSFIKCYKCVASDVLEVYEWPSKYFPYVFVDGLSTWQDGKQWTESLIFVARDPQKAYNYAMSEALNGLSRIRREQVWATPRQLAGQEQILRFPDRTQGALLYNPDPQAASPGPIFRPPEELPDALFKVAAVMEEDIYKTLGIYPANRGEIKEDVSGVALGRTITQGNLMFKKILSNLFFGMQIVGEIILDLIPKIYDSQRIINLIDETGKTTAEEINKINNGDYENNITEGVYKLQIEPIASFASQAEALRKQLLTLVQANSDAAPLVLDIIASTMETPVAPRLVERFQTLVPPAVLAAENGQPPPPPPPPAPSDVYLAAKAKQAESSAQLNHAKAAAEGYKFQQDAQSKQIDAMLQQQRNQTEYASNILDYNKTLVGTHAEITKAKLNFAESERNRMHEYIKPYLSAGHANDRSTSGRKTEKESQP